MRAILLKRGGGPEVLEMGTAIKPQPCVGLVLIRVKAFGINHEEALVRQRYNPRSSAPRILGVEAVGEVAAAPGGEFTEGTTVATALGCLQDQIMGSYAEYISVPAAQVLPIQSSLDWAALGAIPLMFQGAHGSLSSFSTAKGRTLLIRGGTTALGLAVTAMASQAGFHVTGTTRNENHGYSMMTCGASGWLLDHGSLAAVAQKFDSVLDLVGMTTLQDSLCCAKEHGIVCVAGFVGGTALMNSLDPIRYIPNSVSLKSYRGNVQEFMRTPLQKLVNMVEAKQFFLPIAKVFPFEEIVAAHRYLEENHGMGKIVVTL